MAIGTLSSVIATSMASVRWNGVIGSLIQALCMFHKAAVYYGKRMSHHNVYCSTSKAKKKIGKSRAHKT